MALVSPGVEVNVIDESFYTPAAGGTVPMIFVATASNKITALENDKIYSQTFTDTFHRFFYSAALSTFQFPID